MLKSKIALLMLSTLLVPGCASLLPKGPPAPRLYTLNAPRSVVETTQETLPVSLRVTKPQAAPGLESERIALHKTRNQMDYYADVKWAGDVATLLQASLVERLESSRRFTSISNDLAPVASDYNVLTTIQDFQVDRKDGQAQAHVGLSAKLVRMADDTIVQSLRYDEFSPVTDDDIASIVAGFDTAQQQVIDKLTADIAVLLATHDLTQTAPVKPSVPDATAASVLQTIVNP